MVQRSEREREREHQTWAWDLRVGVYVITSYIGIATYYVLLYMAPCVYIIIMCALQFTISVFCVGRNCKTNDRMDNETIQTGNKIEHCILYFKLKFSLKIQLSSQFEDSGVTNQSHFCNVTYVLFKSNLIVKLARYFEVLRRFRSLLFSHFVFN